MVNIQNYMDTDSFFVQKKPDDICEEIAENFENKIWNCKLWIVKVTTETKEQEIYECNKRWIRWKNHERTCSTKNKKKIVVKIKTKIH